ncbi:MAG: RnfABCDGE type electron transport complex subunit G [Lachnospiraceae bacterium]|nr:RnfABCDGE type electron transport complex subunit G [Lachnospiraceae bacterium]
MNELNYGISSSPHTRSRLSTGKVMYDVILALLPATLFGIMHFGMDAVMVIVPSIAAAVLSEFLFNLVCKKPNTLKDGSAVLTGLLLALVLPAGVPIYVPVLGAVFAIVIVKGCFGGLGKNFMNPALAARCFLLISFSSTVTTYKLDGVAGATPLVDLAAGDPVSIRNLFLGFTNGVIGCSIAGLLIGAVYLLVTKGITWEIPVSSLLVFVLFVAIFGGQGFDLSFLAIHLFAGGMILGAFFMATDPVSSPVTSTGQLIYGAIFGLLAGLFRIKGSAADSVSYAIIVANLLTPMIDEFIIPKPFAYRANALTGPKALEKNSGVQFKVPAQAIVLCVITLIAGVGLSGVYTMTKDTIEEQKELAAMESYKAVLPEADSFQPDEALDAQIEAMAGQVYGDSFGRVYINKAIPAVDASGNSVGCVLSVTSAEGFDGNVTLSMGIDNEGTITGIAFTELHETAGMGMRVDEEEFKGQFAGRAVDGFTLNKSGGASSDSEINSVSGASITSGAVVNAVNAGLDFFNNVVKGGN